MTAVADAPRPYGHPPAPARRSPTDRNALFLRHSPRLVGWVLMRHFRRFAAMAHAEDLMQAGSLGLLRACELYDEAEGRFSTFAVCWIFQAIQRELLRVGTITRPAQPRAELPRCEALPTDPRGHAVPLVDPHAEDPADVAEGAELAAVRVDAHQEGERSVSGPGYRRHLFAVHQGGPPLASKDDGARWSIPGREAGIWFIHRRDGGHLERSPGLINE